MTVDTFAEAETLVDDVGPRAPGSSGEHAATGHLAGRLRALGRAAEIEPFAVWPRWPLADALNATAGIAASLLSLEEPRIACGLAGLVTLLTVLDSTGLLTTTRRLLGRRESANVVSWGDRARPGALLLVAHYDRTMPRTLSWSRSARAWPRTRRTRRSVRWCCARLPTATRPAWRGCRR